MNSIEGDRITNPIHLPDTNWLPRWESLDVLHFCSTIYFHLQLEAAFSDRKGIQAWDPPTGWASNQRVPGAALSGQPSEITRARRFEHQIGAAIRHWPQPGQQFVCPG